MRPLSFACLLAVLLTPFLVARDDVPAGEQAVARLYRSGALFDRKQYKAVRAAFAQAFAEKHAATIRAAFGADHDALTAWLAARPDVREELFTAVDDRHDDVEAALKLFARIWKAHPGKVEPYANLAIATAVVWDRPDGRGDKPGGVYDYRRHQVRTRSVMPEGAADAMANFEHAAGSDTALAGNVKLLPWEFLVFVIDHKTPIAERRWAVKYFASRRGKVTSWHQDVEYDKGMLETERTGKGPGPRLSGHEYTLENIKQYGGVCAQQADFVTRVGKSLGQPSVYVSGESSYRGWHAWVMFVTVTKSGKDKVKFGLVSDGRTRGFERDAFYTGWLTDPQTGQRILDRDMERRLGVVADDVRGRRQAGLAMRAYAALELDTKERVAFLNRVLTLVPRAEEAWVEFGRLARAGELTGPHRAAAAARLAALTRTFARHPDFVARLSDDLLAAEPNGLQKARHYQAVVTMFEKAGRPDLCCDARLKLAQLHSEQKRYKEATQALTQAVRKFPTEGRYIPRLLEACEKVCDDYPAGVKPLANLYLELGPALVLHYKGEKNPFLDKVLKQGEAYLDRKSLTREAATFRTRVAQARGRAGS